MEWKEKVDRNNAMNDKWFNKENLDAAEFVDNCNEILTKLQAIEKFRDNELTLEGFWKEVGN